MSAAAGRSRACYFVMRQPDADDPRDETGVLCLRPEGHDDDHSPFSKWQPSFDEARDALVHARQHNEHATRPNQHDEAWASGETECAPSDDASRQTGAR